MAVFYFRVRVVQRSKGRNAVAAAAYRSASRLHDDRLGRDHDFTSKAGVIHTEILLPDGAPVRWGDQQVLWNEVERGETREKAQVARDITMALPQELTQGEAIALARTFVQREFVDRGMVADLNVHWDIGFSGQLHPHAHVMLTMRHVEPDGFGLKDRSWNGPGPLRAWREAWATHVNARLAELGIDARIDHRSLRDQGLDLEPQRWLPRQDLVRQAQGETSPKVEAQRAIARRNGERILRDPSVVLKAMTQQQSTFIREDLARLVFRYSDGKDQFDQAMSAVMSSRHLVSLGRDGKGHDRFTSREMLQTEQDMADRAQAMAERHGHGVSRDSVQTAVREAGTEGPGGGLTLSPEQKAALAHVAGAQDLALVIGYAGSGKSTMLGLAREIWARDGYQVRGATLSGVAAESLEQGTAIPSRTLASLEHAWSRDRDRLTHRDVLVIDEAGLIGSRQMQRVLHEAERAGAKVVMVGDPEQLQAIEAGAAFRALTERHGAIEITQVQRQQQDWQRQATRELATGRTGEALARYGRAGDVKSHDTRVAARQGVVDGWLAHGRQDPASSRMMLAPTRADAAALNGLARDALKAAGALHGERTLETSQGPQAFATGDRLLFLRNERSLGVRNGTVATLEGIDHGALRVRLDDGRRLAFDPHVYADLTHGYAATIHKAQGITLDHVHVLASPSMDRHSAYVALTRHRQGVTLHYGRDDFADPRALVQGLSRERTKDVTLDYGIKRPLSRNTRAPGRQPAQDLGPAHGAASARTAIGHERER